MSSFSPRMSIIEEKIESSDEDVLQSAETRAVSGMRVRFDSATSDKKVNVYIAVEGNLPGTDSFIFGLDKRDEDLIVEKYPREPEVVTNGLCVRGSAIDVVNMLHRLGYAVVDVAGSSIKTWTMVKVVVKN